MNKITIIQESGQYYAECETTGFWAWGVSSLVALENLFMNTWHGNINR